MRSGRPLAPAPEPAVTLAPGLPRRLQVEVTAACNLRCQMCLVRYRPPVNRVTGSMPFDTFRRLVDENPRLESMQLQGLGEPLLAPDLFEMVEYAAARGVSVGFNTNATLLTRDKAERLVRGGLGWLHVSLDGATAETYEAIREGANFDKVRRNLVGLMEVKEALGADRPHVELVFVAMRRNVDELPAVVRMAAAVGVDAVWVQNLSHSFSDTEPAGDYAGIRMFTQREALWASAAPGEPDAFAEARSLAERHGVHLRLPRTDQPSGPRPAGEPGCDWPWEQGYVTHDGTVQPCCMVMGSDRAALGRIGDRSFTDIWYGEEYRAFRTALLTDEPPDVCRGCSVYRHTF